MTLQGQAPAVSVRCLRHVCIAGASIDFLAYRTRYLDEHPKLVKVCVQLSRHGELLHHGTYFIVVFILAIVFPLFGLVYFIHVQVLCTSPGTSIEDGWVLFFPAWHGHFSRALLRIAVINVVRGKHQQAQTEPQSGKPDRW